MKHVLVIDDDERLRDLLKRYLIKQGYSVSTAESAEAARRLLQSFDFDLLIVDVMMPGEDGMSFVRGIRPQNKVPIMMLTAKSELDDRLEGLESGVDDFLPKPFEPRELILRIEAILRRANQSTDKGGINVFGEYHFDQATQKLAKGEEKIELTRNERDVLGILIEHMNETVSREAISEVLGDETNVRNVDVTITRMRKKLEIDPKNPQYIQTVRGKGYKLRSNP